MSIFFVGRITMVKGTEVGRKPIGKKAMTGVEKNRRMLARRRLLHEAAKKHNHTPTMVFLNNMQLEALKELEESFGGKLTGEKLNSLLFGAIKYYLDTDACNHLETIKRDDWPQSSSADQIRIDAGVKFIQWEEQQ